MLTGEAAAPDGEADDPPALAWFQETVPTEREGERAGSGGGDGGAGSGKEQGSDNKKVTTFFRGTL